MIFPYENSKFHTIEQNQAKRKDLSIMAMEIYKF